MRENEQFDAYSKKVFVELVEPALNASVPFTGDQRYNLLMQVPSAPNARWGDMNVASVLLSSNVRGHTDAFLQLTQGLSVAQSYSLLMLAQTNPANLDAGDTVASILLYRDRDKDFIRLTQGLSAAQSYSVLMVGPTNPASRMAGVTVAGRLLCKKRYEDFTRLTQGLSAAQSYSVLISAPTNPQYHDAGRTVAWVLLRDERCEDFTRLTQDLNAEQACSLLKSKPVHFRSRSPMNLGQYCEMRTTAELLLMRARFDDFIRLTQGFDTERMCEIYKEIKCWETDMSESEQRFYDFSYLARPMSTQQIFELISKDYKGSNITHSLLEKIQADEHMSLTSFLNSLQDAPSTNPLLIMDVAYRCFVNLIYNLTNILAEPKLIKTAEVEQEVERSLREIWDLVQFILRFKYLPLHYRNNAFRNLDNLTSLAFKSEVFTRLFEDFLDSQKSDLYTSLKNVSSEGHFLETLAFYYGLCGRKIESGEAKHMAIRFAESLKKALTPFSDKMMALSVPGDAIIDDEISRNKRSREQVSDEKVAENVNSESTPSLQSNAMSFFSVPSGDAIIGDENSRKRSRELKGDLEVAESVVSKPTPSHQTNATSFFSVPPDDAIIDDEMLSTKRPRDDEEPNQSHAPEEASDAQKMKRSN